VAPRRKQAGSKRTANRKAPAARGKASKGRRSARAAGPASEDAYPEVEALVDLMDRHGLLEVDYETGADGTRRIRVSRAGGRAIAGAAHLPLAALGTDSAPPPGAAQAPVPDAPSGSPASSEAVHAFKSPMVGTFYRAASPETPPFASVGDHVDASTTVCIIEAMKVMNEIVPDVGGEIVSIEVENGEAVEYGQTLFLIRTA
jgi:acetyl-CoA carboxylase biotin carboxyl carrier protein